MKTAPTDKPSARAAFAKNSDGFQIEANLCETLLFHIARRFGQKRRTEICLCNLYVLGWKAGIAIRAAGLSCFNMFMVLFAFPAPSWTGLKAALRLAWLVRSSVPNGFYITGCLRNFPADFFFLFFFSQCAQGEYGKLQGLKEQWQRDCRMRVLWTVRPQQI